MIRLLIADDHKLFRDGLRRILEMEEDLVVVGEASDGEEACRMAAALRPEVVLMDISMPTVNGVEATEYIVRTVPDCRVIILSIHDDEAYVYRALSGGAKGYLLKEMDSEELIEAVRTVARGEAYIHPRVTN
jgi:Response regulator containing a CheY-like receiver domain and an HTH DNA-binding domain